jgi:hypothetical protein
MTTATQAWATFAAALAADGPHPDHEADLMTFGRFVGSWALDARFYDRDGTVVSEGPATWTFAWILDGRALQDVLELGSPDDGAPVSRGSTIRYFNPDTRQWYVHWLGSITGIVVQLHGPPSHGDIALEGVDVDGNLLRWTFEDVTADSFHWRGVTSEDGGATWYLEQDMSARRRHD